MTGRRAAVLTSGLVFLGVVAGVAIAEEMPQGKPVNIKVLPKDISATEIRKVMKRYETELGVECDHCHVEDPNTRKFDYASDDNPAKSSARLMIAMLKDINEKYLPQLGADSRYAAPVTCGSCHQGQSSPPTYWGEQ